MVNGKRNTHKHAYTHTHTHTRTQHQRYTEKKTIVRSERTVEEKKKGFIFQKTLFTFGCADLISNFAFFIGDVTVVLFRALELNWTYFVFIQHEIGIRRPYN